MIKLVTLVIFVNIFSICAANPFVWGGNDRDELSTVLKNSSGKYVVGGFSSSTDLPNNGGKDVLILEISESNGIISNPSNFIFYGNSDDQELFKLIQSSSGDYIGCGRNISTTKSGIEGYLFKTSSLFTNSISNIIGNSGGEEEFRDLIEIENGYLVVGFDEVNDEARMWLVKTDTNLTQTSAFIHFGEDDTISDKIYSIVKLGNESFLVAGEGVMNVRKLDTTLTQLDSWKFDISTIYDIDIADSDGGFLICGNGNKNIQKLDSNGSIIWSKQYNSDTFTSFTYNGSYYTFTGYTLSQDIIVLKLDLDGSEISYDIYSGTKGADQGRSIVDVPSGGSIIAGFTYTSSVGGSSDIWIKKIDGGTTYLPPSITDIPNQSVESGSNFNTISLDNFVSDPDTPDDQLTWTVTGNTSLSVSVINRVATISYPNDWTGSETLTFAVTDPQNLSDSDNAVFSVTSGDQPIVVTGISPTSGGNFEMNEGTSQIFSINAYDPDGNTLTYSWKKNSVQVSTTSSYNFATNYQSAGNYTLTLDVSDGSKNSINYSWNITVIDVNQPIVVNTVLPSAGGSLSIDEGDSQQFSIDAIDPDGGQLTYSWTKDGVVVSTSSSYLLTTNSTSAGVYAIQLVVIDIGGSVVNYQWSVTVNDIDQPIVVNSLSPAQGTINMNENENRTFTIDAYDPDGNNLTYNWKLNSVSVNTTNSYTYSAGYSSAGNHTLTLAVSDGQKSLSNFSWTIVVANVDQPVQITDHQPSSFTVSMNEGSSTNFSVSAIDPDGVAVSYQWKLDGVNQNQSSYWTYSTDYNSAGNHIVSCTVTGDNNSETLTWNVTVNNVDRPIVVNSISPSNGGNLSIYENSTTNFSIDAYDPDGNNLTFNWKLDNVSVSSTSSYSYVTNFNSAGAHTLVLTVSDGSKSTITKTWNITVLEVNQNIVIDDIQPSPGGSIEIDETENIAFSVVAHDPDGGDLSYTWKKNNVIVSLSNSYNFVTSYTSAGDYTIELTISEAKDKVKESIVYTWQVHVNNVNRPIVVNSISPDPAVQVNINEGDQQNFNINAYDPDGNTLLYSWKLDGTVTSTSNSYNYLPDYNSSGVHSLNLTVSDLDSNISYDWNIFVENTNQTIIIDSINPDPSILVELYEGEEVDFNVIAHDPDGGMLTYEWKLDDQSVSNTSGFTYSPDFNSAGTHSVTLQITDEDNSSISREWNVNVVNVTTPIIVNLVVPSPEITMNINEGDEINFYVDAEDSGGGEVSFVWKLDDIEKNYENSWSYQTDVNSSGNHIVEVTISNESKHIIVYHWFINVTDVNIPVEITYLYPPEGGLTIYEGEDIYFTVSANDPEGNEISYQWFLNSDLVDSDSLYTFQTDNGSNGLYNLQLIVSDNAKKLSKNSDNVIKNWSINVLDIPDHINITEVLPSFGGNLAINEGDEVLFSINAAGAGCELNYQWLLDNEIVSDNNMFQFSTNSQSSGFHSTKLIVTAEGHNPFNLTWLIDVQNVNGSPVINSFLPIETNIQITTTPFISFSVDATDPDGDALNYSWFLNNELMSNSQNNFSYVFELGQHFVKSEINDGVDTVSVEWNITFIDDINENIPQVTELKSISPNPFNPITRVNYSLSESSNPEIYIFNSNGQTVKKFKFEHANPGFYSIEFDGSLLNSGTYFVRFQTNKVNMVKKVVLLK
ncbi:MAG: PKD domain-containing protein [Candidatus Delongbacteria bacterium]|nr:PKD domain-containing protein [Candidatus Delongbacteria bacterium]MBN2834369.1 PKD domain-containing protein [Candidatus Delongbacteria bacterium]